MKSIKKHYLKFLTFLCSVSLIFGLITVNPVYAQTDSYLPKTPETKKVIVFDLSHDLKNHDAEAKEAYMAITSIQGIINRTSSTKIYLTHTPQEHDWTPYPADQSWLDNGLIPAEKEYPPLDYGKKYPVLSYLLEQYNNQLKGIIQVPQLSGKIIDGAVMAGVTAAGIEDSILVSPNIEKYVQNEGYHFETKANTRGFKNNIEAFDWAYKNYFSRCNKTFVAQHSYTAFGGGMSDQFPIMYDYYISSQVFVFCLNGNKEDELKKLQEFFVPENYALGTAVLGLPVDEGKGISSISERGYYFSIMYVPNLTVTSSFKYDPDSIKEPALPTAVENIDKDTNYVAFFVTDGDSMGFPTSFMYEKITNSPARGEIPIGWSFNPHLIDIFPTLLSFYSENNYNTFYEYVASMNNGGSPKGDTAYEVFKDRYINYINKSKGMMRTINYFNEDEYVNSLTKAINPYLLIKGYQGQTDGNDTQWGTIPDTNITFTTMSGATQGNARTENIYKALKHITTQKDKDNPTFTLVCIGDGRHSGDSALHVKEAISQLHRDDPNSQFTFMRPSDLAATYKKHKGETVKEGNPKVVTFNNNNTVNKIIADKKEIQLNEGTSTSIKGYALNDQEQIIFDKTIQYSISEDQTIASVDANGNINALHEGKTTLKIECDGHELNIPITVIGKKPTSIAVDKQKFSTAVGGQATITATLYDQFGNKLDTPTFKWVSQDNNIVSVSDNGLIIGKKPGKTTITVSYENLETNIEVTVLESTSSISKIIIDPSYIEMYPNDIYKVTVNAYDKDNNEVFGFKPEWSIKDETIAQIDENGYITGLKDGLTEITATYDGQATHSIDLLVKKENRTIEKFENLNGTPDQSEFTDMIFEAGFNSCEDKGKIQGNAIRLDGSNGAKTVTFKNNQVLKSIKAYNPSDKVVKVTLNGNDAGIMTYQIEPHQSLTLKTNWDKEIKSFVISRSDSDVPIAFGEFAYGKADPIPTTLKITPDKEQINIFKNNSLNLKATLYDQNNNEMPTDYLEWSTDRDDIVTVDKNGKITGVEVGSTFIYAKANGLVASVMVYVTEDEVHKIELTPEVITFYINDIIPLSAQALDSENRPIDTPITFESSNNDIVEVINGHYAKAKAEGTTTIKVNVSGKERLITVYVKPHPSTDKIIDFKEYEKDYILKDTDLVDERFKFENGFYKINEDVPGIEGKTIHFIDDQTGEKAFWVTPETTIKSVKVHNPTNEPRKFIIKPLGGTNSSLPTVENIIQPGETRTIFTGYDIKDTSYVFETFWQVQIGEIVYTDTLDTGFTAKDIAKGITFIKQPSLGQKQIELPHIDGFDITISDSNLKDIISLNGHINPIGIDQDVELILQVKNKKNPNDIAKTTAITVKVLGIPANKDQLYKLIDQIEKMELSQYKPSTVENLNKTLTKAKDAMNNLSIRQSEVDALVEELNQKINLLEKKANKSLLQNQINHIYQMDLSQYTPESINQLKGVINDALKLLDDNEVDQATIDKMLETLNTSINQLQPKAEKENLIELYNRYSHLDLSHYTPESQQALSNMLIKAKNAIDNPNISQEDINKLILDLQNTYEKLEKKNDININPDDSNDDKLNDSTSSNDSTKNPNSNVQTSDQTEIILPVLFTIISMLGVLFIYRRKNS